MGDHAAKKDVRGRFQPAHADRLPLEITNRPDALGAEQLEAAHVNPGQKDDRRAPVQADGRKRREVVADVGLAGAQRLVEPGRSVGTDVLHIGEALASQEVFRHVLWSEAKTQTMVHAEPSRLGRRVGSNRPRSDRPPLAARRPPMNARRSIIPSVPWVTPSTPSSAR